MLFNTRRKVTITFSIFVLTTVLGFTIVSGQDQHLCTRVEKSVNKSLKDNEKYVSDPEVSGCIIHYSSPDLMLIIETYWKKKDSRTAFASTVKRYKSSRNEKDSASVKKLGLHRIWYDAVLIMFDNGSHVMVLRRPKKVITVLSPDSNLLLAIEAALRPLFLE